MLDAPQIAQTREACAALLRLTVPRSDIQRVMGPGLRELLAVVAAQGMVPLGPWFTHHFRMDPGTFDFEIGVPTAQPVTATGRVVAGTVPAARVAQALYRGGYEGLPGAWREMDAWVAANGHAPEPDIWECYLVGPETSTDPANWRTELIRPLKHPQA